MEPTFSINPERTGFYYSVFYLLAFLAGFVWLLREGKKRKFPTIQWMLVILTAFLFFIVGCRLIAFSKAEWSYVLRFESIPYTTSRSVLGGILLSVPGILLAKKCLRFQYNMMDGFALVLPFALVIQRFGCLLAGCCYGSPTRMPWAVHYGTRSHAFAEQVTKGLIAADSHAALPIHPVQLYEVIGCLVIMLVLFKIRNVFKAEGNYFLTSIGLYGFVRFFLEFFRATGGHSVGGDQLITLTYVQWAILVVVPLLFLLIWKSEKNMESEQQISEYVCQDFFRPAIYFLMIVSLFLIVSNWLNKIEILSLTMVLVPIVAIQIWYLFTRVTVPKFRLASLALPVLALVLMSQTLPESHSEEDTKSSYNMISMGIMGGTTDLIYGDDVTDDCNDGGNRTLYSNDYKITAFGYAHTNEDNVKSKTMGLNVFFGSHDESAFDNLHNSFQGGHNNYSVFGLNPYARFDYKQVGVGVGMSIGEFTSIVPVTSDKPSSVKQRGFYPSFSLRGGDRRTVYVEYKFANQFPASFPALNQQLYLGFGTTKRDHVWRGGGLRIGTASNAGIFISTTTVFGKTVLMETFLGGLGGLFNPYDFTHSTIGSLSLHVKFGKDIKK